MLTGDYPITETYRLVRTGLKTRMLDQGIPETIENIDVVLKAMYYEWTRPQVSDPIAPEVINLLEGLLSVPVENRSLLALKS